MTVMTPSQPSDVYNNRKPADQAKGKAKASVVSLFLDFASPTLSNPRAWPSGPGGQSSAPVKVGQRKPKGPRVGDTLCCRERVTG